MASIARSLLASLFCLYRVAMSAYIHCSRQGFLTSSAQVHFNAKPERRILFLYYALILSKASNNVGSKIGRRSTMQFRI